MSAKDLVVCLEKKQMTVATAESCSGGLLAAAITEIAGASHVFGYGLVTYSNQAKTELLGVCGETLALYGAVSEQTARAMAKGLLALSGADVVLVTTGIAGPSGGSTEKPVGLVYIGVGGKKDIHIRALPVFRRPGRDTAKDGRNRVIHGTGLFGKGVKNEKIFCHDARGNHAALRLFDVF